MTDMPFSKREARIAGPSRCCRLFLNRPLFFFTLLLTWLSTAHANAVTLSLVDARVSLLPPGAAQGSGLLSVRAEGLDAGARPTAASLTVGDPGIPGTQAPAVKPEVIGDEAPTPTSHVWHVNVGVTGLPPRTTETRYLKVLLASGSVGNLQYTLTNQDPLPSTWPVKRQTADWLLYSGRRTALGIVQGPVTGLKIAFCNLQEQSAKTALPCEQLHLCSDVTGSDVTRPCRQELQLPSGAHGVFLEVDPKFGAPGNFQGSVQVTSTQKPEAEVFQLNLFNSSPNRRLAGFGLIVIGIALAWWINAYVPRQVERDQVLASAAAMRESLAALAHDLQSVPADLTGDVQQTQGVLDDRIASLAPQRLSTAGFLRSRFPLPWDSALDPRAYQTFIEGFNEPLKMLTVLIHDGILKALTYLDAPTRGAIPAALQNMDALSLTNPPSESAVSQALPGLLAPLRPPGAAPNAQQPQAQPLLTYQQIRLEMTRLGAWGWVIWAALGGLIAYYVLVQSKPGFGLPADYLLCLLWGFGIPAAGNQLTSLSIGSVTTALKVGVFK